MKSENNPAPDVMQTLGLDKAPGRGKKLRWWLVLPLLVIILTTAAIIWRSAGDTNKTHYITREVKRGDLTIIVTATGTLEPTNQVDVGTEVSGTIDTVEVDYNDQVKVGQVLARLDTSKLESQVLKSRAALNAARARIQEADATIREARSQLTRMKQVRELSGGKVPSQYDLDVAEAALARALADHASAESSVAEAKAVLESNETDLSKAVIHSPVNGIVLVRAVEPGQTVAASLQAPVLFTLAEDLTQMELHVDVDEADVGQVKEGQHATFTVDAYPDRTFTAEITQVRFGSQTVEGVVTYETLLGVNNSDLSLRPGMTATADITVNRIKDALLVPNAALRFSPPRPKKKPDDVGFIDKLIPRFRRRRAADNAASRTGRIEGPRVWVLTDNDRQPVRPVEVKTGLTDGIVTAITGGTLEQGQKVIVGAEVLEK